MTLRVLVEDQTIEAKFTMAPGFHAVFGASGVGKTTLFRMISGLLRPRVEYLTWNDVAFHQNSPRHRPVAWVPQRVHLIPERTIGQQVTWVHGHDRFDDLSDWLDILHLHELWAKYPREVSGGELQRAGLLRALVAKRPILLLDEALSQVDRPLRDAIVTHLKERRRPQHLVIFTSHDWEETVAHADTVLWMNQGSPVNAPQSPRTLLPDNPLMARLMGYIGTIPNGHGQYWIVHPNTIRVGAWPDQGHVLVGQLHADPVSPVSIRYHFRATDSNWSWVGPPSPESSRTQITLLNPYLVPFSVHTSTHIDPKQKKGVDRCP